VKSESAARHRGKQLFQQNRSQPVVAYASEKTLIQHTAAAHLRDPV
jgi:heat shock protein HspQ